MVRHCIVKGCGVKMSKAPIGVSLHKFPKRNNMHLKWISVIEAATKTKCLIHNFSNQAVCSLHFTPDSFSPKAPLPEGIEIKQRPILKSDAVPSVFFVDDEWMDIKLTEEEIVDDPYDISKIHRKKCLFTRRKIGEIIEMNEETIKDLTHPELTQCLKLSILRLRALEELSKVHRNKAYYYKKKLLAMQKNKRKAIGIGEEASLLHDLISKKKKTIRKYSPKVKQFVLDIHATSPQSYSKLQKYFEEFNLPSIRTISLWKRSSTSDDKEEKKVKSFKNSRRLTIYDKDAETSETSETDTEMETSSEEESEDEKPLIKQEHKEEDEMIEMIDYDCDDEEEIISYDPVEVKLENDFEIKIEKEQIHY